MRFKFLGVRERQVLRVIAEYARDMDIPFVIQLHDNNSTLKIAKKIDAVYEDENCLEIYYSDNTVLKIYEDIVLYGNKELSYELNLHRENAFIEIE